MIDSDTFAGALCRANPELFNERGGKEPRDAFRRRLEHAEATCWQCPVRAACQDHAATLDTREHSGIYAGRHLPWGKPAA
jgi:hypothetical protein